MGDDGQVHVQHACNSRTPARGGVDDGVGGNATTTGVNRANLAVVRVYGVDFRMRMELYVHPVPRPRA